MRYRERPAGGFCGCIVTFFVLWVILVCGGTAGIVIVQKPTTALPSE